MSRARGLSFDGMLVGLLFVVVAFGAFLTVAQADTFWALRAGQDIWRTGHVPNTDTYSFTAFGQPWPDHEWLWQAVAYPIFRVGGFPLLTAFAAVLVIAAVAIVYRLTVGAVPTRFALVALAIPLSSLVWALRPQLVTLLALAVLLWLLVHERFAWLPPLFLVWANAHGGVALGGVVLIAACAAAGLRAWRAEATPDDRRRARRLGVVAPLCVLATALTPLGLDLFRFVVASEARLRAAHISEWLPPSLGLLAPFWIFAIAFVGLLIVRRRRLGAASWQDWVSVAAVVALLPFAARSARQIGPWLLLAPVATSRLLGPDFRWRRRPRAASPDHPRLNLLVLASFVAALVLCVGVAWARPLPRLGWRPVPEAALTALRACPDPLYNHYDEGGYLIWLLPERKVFVDNRQDPYALPFLIEHARVESGHAPWEPLFR
ncbi:MAG TPA: hypothetical protein VK989_09235, partial [Polyangia bacterium]|nr:hypothetical protein [Polyangia bacterium]